MFGDGFIFRIAFHRPLPAAEALSREPFQQSREPAVRTPSTGFPERVRGPGRTQARAPLAAPAPAPPARRFPQSPATPRLRDPGQAGGGAEAAAALRALSGKSRTPPAARRRPGSAISGPTHFGKFRSRLSEMAARRQGERRIPRGLQGGQQAARAAFGNPSFVQAAVASRP